MLGKIVADKTLDAHKDAYMQRGVRAETGTQAQLSRGLTSSRVYTHLLTHPTHTNHSSACSSAEAPSFFLSSADLHIAK